MQIKISYWAFVFISIILLITNFTFFPNNIISWDVFGYYIYLPMTFIYDNLGLQDINIVKDIIAKYNSSSTLYQAYQTSTGSWIMRYPMGMAVMFSPFFALAHLFAGLTDYPRDGFSYPYQLAILSGGVIYSIIGFYFLRKVLLQFFEEKVAAISLLVIFLGTNYLWHAGFHGTNAMAHSYLFSLYALLLWITVKWHESFKTTLLLIGAIVCGLIILSRPSELVCLFIPLLWKVGTEYSVKQKLLLFWDKRKQILGFAAVLFVIGMPQLLYWKIIAGKFIYNSYGDNPGEGFEFLNPFIMEVLFSFRKGWLIYTPVIIFAIAGLVIALRRKTDFSIPAMIFFVLNLYIVSSWSCWWYAESFSQRSLVQSYAVLSLPLGLFISYLFNEVSKVPRKIILTGIWLLVGLNLFQTWQFLEGMIHSSRMTKEAYLSVFMKTKKPDNFESLLMIDRSSATTDSISTDKYEAGEMWIQEFETDPKSQTFTEGLGSKSIMMDSPDTYSPAIEKAYFEITQQEHAFLKISMKVYIPGDSTKTAGALVAAMYHENFSYGYKSVDLESLNLAANSWNTVSFNYLTPVIRNKKDKLKVYYWHRGERAVYIDDIKVEVFEMKSQK